MSIKKARGKVRGKRKRAVTLDDFFMTTPEGEVVKFWKIAYRNALGSDQRQRPRMARGAATRATAERFGFTERKVQRTLEAFGRPAIARQQLADEMLAQHKAAFDLFAAVQKIFGSTAVDRCGRGLELVDILPNAVKSAAVRIATLESEAAELRASNAKLIGERDAAVNRAMRAESDADRAKASNVYYSGVRRT